MKGCIEPFLRIKKVKYNTSLYFGCFTMVIQKDLKRAL